MTGRPDRVRARIGGRWAVSWQGYLLLSPLAIPLALLVVPAFFQPTTWPTGLALATVAYLAAGGVLALASVTVLRGRRERPAPTVVVVAVGGAAWLVRSAVFAGYLAATGSPADTPVYQRLLVGFILGALLVPGVAWLLASIDEFRVERRRLLQQLVERELQAEGSASYLALMHQTLVAELNSRVREAAAALPAPPDESDQVLRPGLAEQFEALDEALRRTPKQLAQDLWTRAEEGNRLPLRAILLATARRPFTLWPILPFVVVAVLYLMRFTDVRVTVLAVGAAAAWGTAVAAVANRVCGRRQTPPVVRYLVFVLLLLCSGALAVVSVHLAGWPIANPTELMLVLGLPFTVLMVAGGVARGVNVAEADVLADLQASISAAEVRARMLDVDEARLRRQLAVHLHGTVGANLTAASMRLRQALDEGDALGARVALAEARRQLDVDLATTLLVERSDLDALLADLRQSWSGIAEIQVAMAAPPSLTPRTVRVVVDVVTEAINNAVRHGDAETIDVRIDFGRARILVDVSDDGLGRENPSRGLGSSLFDEAAPGSWWLATRPSGGHHLIVEIPIDEQRGDRIPQ